MNGSGRREVSRNACGCTGRSGTEYRRETAEHLRLHPLEKQKIQR